MSSAVSPLMIFSGVPGDALHELADPTADEWSRIMKFKSWPRFTLSQLLILILGIAIGLVPLHIWRLRNAALDQIAVHVHLLKADAQTLALLGMDASELSITSSAPTQIANGDDLLRSVADRNAILAAPTLVTVSGRDAAIQCSTTIPYPTLADDGTIANLTRDIGTYVTVQPTVLRNGNVLLNIKPTVTSIAENTSTSSAPTIRTLSYNATMELANDSHMVVPTGIDPSTNTPLLVIASAQPLSTP